MKEFEQPIDATHQWTAAIYPQRMYYKFDNDCWQSWSPALQMWCESHNEDWWFTQETIAGFFVEVKDPALD